MGSAIEEKIKGEAIVYMPVWYMQMRCTLGLRPNVRAISRSTPGMEVTVVVANTMWVMSDNGRPHSCMAASTASMLILGITLLAMFTRVVRLFSSVYVASSGCSLITSSVMHVCRFSILLSAAVIHRAFNKMGKSANEAINIDAT